MKKIYIVLLLLITGVTKNYAQADLLATPEAESQIKVCHHPEKKAVQISYVSKLRSDLKIKIKDHTGKVLYSLYLTDQKFQHNKLIDVANYSKGTYFVEIDTERTQQIDRVELN
jgi:hypothetical protein